MKKRTSKLLCLLLALVMALSLMPTAALAAGDEAEECPGCGHLHWGDYLCECGYCSINCSNASCWIETHCLNCAACHGDDVYCPDCGWCNDCRVEECHCLDCGKCFVGGGDDERCTDCGKCEDCVGWLCLDCGQCDECTDNGDFHCEECGGCYEVNGHNHDTHCADCCEFCEQCGECIITNETELCFECGLCVECCEENRADSDCSCGEYCVESVEFDEHFCEFCGNCFDDIDKCELCYLCADCCADNSDCSDGMCVEDPDYEEHFCADCGTCFHEADPCEICCNEGELRCVYCCESLAFSYGCSCGDVCVNDPDFEEHLDTYHNEDGVIGPHSAKPQIGWSMDDTDHWHGCRLCGEAAHITDKANHSYDKYGVCTVCGFKQGASVFVTYQPRDVFAKVTNINADEYDPLFWKNNTVSFKVSAFGEGLTYQWYRSAGSGTPVKLTSDPSKVNTYSYGAGATTDKVTVYVPGDACTTDYTYFCVVTDKDGNTAKSVAAHIKASHDYSRCQNVVTGTAYRIYVQSGSSYTTKTYYNSEGHFWSCCGEEDFGDGETDFGNTRTKKPVSHNYKNQELIQATRSSTNAAAGKFDTYYRYTCADCGNQIYVQKHVHNFECPVPNTEENIEYLEKNCTALTHPLVCTVAGCTETRTEQHRWQWRIAGYPSDSVDGAMMRECLDCEYVQYKEWTDRKGNHINWTTSNMLVSASNGTVNRSLAAPGGTVKLTPKQFDGSRCIGWRAEYTDYSTGVANTKYVTVFTTKNDDGTWSCTIPTFEVMGVNGGGQLGFSPKYTSCSHSSGTRLEGCRAAVCTRNGYTGDTVCNACGKIMETGDPIVAPGYHTGTLTPVPGTAVEADCTHRGYSGDLKCSDCGSTVAGEKTGYKHGDDPNIRNYVKPTCYKEGYSGDEYCNLCDKLIGHGKILPITHSTRTNTYNVAYATCTESGYTGDTKCLECGQIFNMGKTIHPLGHAWDEGTVIKEATETERGEIRYTCTHVLRGVPCGETKIEYIPRLTESRTGIVNANVTVSAPAPGSSPAKASASGTQFTVVNTSWEPDPGKVFADNKQYSVVVTLEANSGFKFTSDTVFKVNGCSAAVVTLSADEAKISFAFPVNPFKDVPAGAYYYDAVMWAANEGITGGTDATHFSPNAICTRAQAVTFLWRAAGSPEPKSSSMPFKDVPAGSYYEKAVLWAVEQGITNGTSKTAFSPNAKCTRAQIVTFLWRSQNSPAAGSVNPFKDVPADAYYAQAVLWAVKEDVTKGTSATTFSPNANCTRAQIVTFLWRALT